MHLVHSALSAWCTSSAQRLMRRYSLSRLTISGPSSVLFCSALLCSALACSALLCLSYFFCSSPSFAFIRPVVCSLDNGNPHVLNHCTPPSFFLPSASFSSLRSTTHYTRYTRYIYDILYNTIIYDILIYTDRSF